MNEKPVPTKKKIADLIAIGGALDYIVPCLDR